MSKDSEKKVKRLKVFESQFNLNVSPLEFKFEQQRNESLRTAWNNTNLERNFRLDDLSIGLK